MNSNYSENDMIDLSDIRTALESELSRANLPSARMYKIETFFLYFTDACMCAILLALIYIASMGDVPWYMLIIVAIVFMLLSRTNHRDHYNSRY